MTQIRSLTALVLFVLLTAITTVPAGLIHRYSFTTDVSNSVGSADGVLVNNTGNAAFTGGQVVFGNDGSQNSSADNGDYVDLPNGIITALGNQVTFEAWVTWTGDSSWQRIFDFGTSDAGENISTGARNSTYIICTPKSGPGPLRYSYNYGPTRSENMVDAPGPLLDDEERHVVATWDEVSNTTALYVNGVLQNTGSMHFGLSAMTDNNNWLGRAQYADPMFCGSFNEFRIWDHAMTADEVAQSFTLGPDTDYFDSCFNPTPASGAVGLSTPLTLEWETSNHPDTSQQILYWSTDETAVRTATAASTNVNKITLGSAVRQYTPISLAQDATYYWRVDLINTAPYTLKGSVWNFTTRSLTAENPVPADDATNQSTLLYLYWDQPATATGYNIYFGTESDNLALAGENQTALPFRVSNLSFGTEYFWRVDPIFADTTGTGAEWSFTTGSISPVCLPGDMNNDLFVNVDDLIVFAGAWMTDTQCSGFDCPDFTQDGKVNLTDFGELTSRWMSTYTPKIIINEINYHPDENTEPIEFIELYNADNCTVNLSNWFFSDGITYSFAQGTSIAPGQFLVIAQNPVALQTKFSLGFVPMGPYDGKLSNQGEKVVLRDQTGRKIDQVDYNNSFPWPVAAGGDGASMELLNPELDNDLSGSWRSSGYAYAEPGPAVILLPENSDQWHYRKGTSEPDASWAGDDYVEDGTWQIGQTSIGYADNDDNTVLNDMEDNYSSIYLRHTLNFVAEADIPNELPIEVYVDDGCIVYVNGTEVDRLYVDANPKTYSDVTGLNDHEATGWDTITLTNARNLLHVGTNVIAIHVLNATLSSSDLSIDARITLPASEGVESAFGSPTPGAVNSVLTGNVPPQLRQVEHTPESPTSGDPVTVSIKVTDPDSVQKVELYYQTVAPGQYIPSHFPVAISTLKTAPDTLPERNPEYFDEQYWTKIQMVDDGTGADTVAGDSVYTTTLPAQSHRTLVRYRFKAWDTLNNLVTAPYYDDASLNFAYYSYDGVPAYATHSAATMNSLPIYQVLTREADWMYSHGYVSGSQIDQFYGGSFNPARFVYNWWGTFVYDGKVYDNIRYRLRGANGRYLPGNGKRSMRFRFNRGHYFQARDQFDKKYDRKWRTLTTYKGIENRSSLTYSLNEHINYYLYSLLNVPALRSHWFHWRVVYDVDEAQDNYRGDFWGIGFASETYDSRFLDSNNMEDGNLYKLINSTTSAEKQKRYQAPLAVTNGSDHNTIQWGLTSSSSVDFITNHVNLENWYAYHAYAQAVRHYDYWPSANKNCAWYFEPDYRPENNNRGRLWTLPWDTDASWGPTWNAGQDVVYNSIFNNSAASSLKPAYFNKIREVYDLLWQQDQIEPLLEYFASQITDFVPADHTRWIGAPSDVGNYNSVTGVAKTSLDLLVQDMKNFAFIGGSWPGGDVGAGGRQAFLLNLSRSGQSAYIPNTPTISYIGTAGYPENDLRFETTAFSDPQGSSTFASLRWRVAEVSDSANPIYDSAELPILELQTIWDSSEITTATQRTVQIPASIIKPGHTYRIRCIMKDNSGRTSHYSAPHQFVAGEALSAGILENLRVTEVMYNPADANPSKGELSVDNDEFEYIELKNIGDNTLDLTYVIFTGGISFTFDGSDVTTLLPGAYVLVVKNKSAFESRYGTSLPVAGEFDDSKLSNSGETIKLEDFWNGTIVEFEYNDGFGWPIAADGAGHSLVPLDSAIANQPSDSLDYSLNWRQSGYINGSPGSADPIAADSIVINEIMAHTDYSNPSHPEYDSNDWIELYNPTGSAVSFDHWYSSDDSDDLKKWKIPYSTLNASSRILFDEVSGFHSPITTGFGLDKAGEQVFLSYLPGNGQDRVVDSVKFKGQANSIALGRYPDGGNYFFAMTGTPNSSNALPNKHLTITEVMYSPSVGSGHEEFVVIGNNTSGSVNLYNLTGSWRLNGAVQYSFPSNYSLPRTAKVIIVGFDPSLPENAALLADFKTVNNVPGGVAILGPWSGTLENSSERLTLEQPLAPDPPEVDPSWIIAEEVNYANQSPWPNNADGTGYSLQRTDSSSSAHGSDPANWTAASPGGTL